MSFLIRPASRQISSTLRSPAFRSNPAIKASGFTLPFTAFFGNSASKSDDMSDHPVQKSDTEWRAVLSPEQVSLGFGERE